MFSGQKIILRELRETDLETLNRWMNDWAVASTLLRRVPSSLLSTKNWHTALQQDNSRIIFAIETSENFRFIGCVGLDAIDLLNRNGRLYIYIGEKALWDQGYGTDAIETFLNYISKNLDLNKIYLTVLAENEKGRRFYQKLGFQEEGLFVQDIFWEGEYKDIVRMAKIQKRSSA